MKPKKYGKRVYPSIIISIFTLKLTWPCDCKIRRSELREVRHVEQFLRKKKMNRLIKKCFLCQQQHKQRERERERERPMYVLCMFPTSHKITNVKLLFGRTITKLSVSSNDNFSHTLSLYPNFLNPIKSLLLSFSVFFLLYIYVCVLLISNSLSCCYCNF